MDQRRLPPAGTAEAVDPPGLTEVLPGSAASTLQVPQVGYYWGLDGQVYRRPLPLHERLRRLRRRVEGVQRTATLVCTLLVLSFALSLLMNLASTLGTLLSDLGVFGIYGGIFIIVITAVLGGAGLIYGAWSLTARQFAQAFQHHYAKAWTTVASSQLPLAIADEHFWRQVTGRVREAPMLRWLSPPDPKRLEDQLEYAAAYSDSLLQLLALPEQISTNSLQGGSCLWHSNRPACYIGGYCVSSCGLFSLIYYYFAFRGMIRKGAMLAALCDFFLDEGEAK